MNTETIITELRAEIAQLKGALALGQENCDAEYEALREERDTARDGLRDSHIRAEQLEARVRELEALLASEKATRNAIIAKGLAVEQCVAELEAALREMYERFKDIPEECDHPVGICWCAEIRALDKSADLLARAESATSAKHPDTERLAYVAKHFANAIHYCCRTDGDEWNTDFYGTLDKWIKRDAARKEVQP